jgi:hypothetical protein
MVEVLIIQEFGVIIVQNYNNSGAFQAQNDKNTMSVSNKP